MQASSLPHVLVFSPHPDDAEFSAGGLIARLVSEGKAVRIIHVTDGSCGSFVEDEKSLIRIRRSEAQQAAGLLCVEVEFLGYSDYSLDTLPAGELRERFVRLLRTYRPLIAISPDPYARNEGHPDHRAVASAAGDALNHAALPLIYPQHQQQGLEPHFVPEKYYYSEDAGLQNQLVDISPWMETKLAAMLAHHSQVEFLVEDFLRQASLAGLDRLELGAGDQDDPASWMRTALLTQAGAYGKQLGVAYAETYRYTRFHPFIESVLTSRDQ